MPQHTPPSAGDRRSETLACTMAIMMAVGSLRLARAAIFAALCVGLSAAGHVWMSGDVIPLWSVGLAFGVLTASGYVLARRQFGFVAISALMLLGELGQHYLFAAAQGPMVDQQVPALPQFVSGRVVPASAWICGMPHSAAMNRGAVGGFGGMVAAHIVAGLVAAWWLRCGDAAVFRMLRVLAAMAVPMLAILWPAAIVVPDFLRTGPRADDDDLGRYRKRLLSSLVVRRGPPLCPRICAI